MKEKNLHSIMKCWEMLGLYSLIAVCFCIASVASLLGAVTGYDVDALGGFGMGLLMAFSMLLSGVGVFISAIYSQNYQLICVVPLKASTVPQQMALLVDIIHVICAAADVIFTVLCGHIARLPMRLIMLLFLYIIAHSMLCAIVSPGMRNVNFQETSKGKGVVLYIIYLVCLCAVIVMQVLLTESFITEASAKPILLLVLLGAAAAAVIARIVTYRILRNKVRMIKASEARRARKAKREESYV